MLSGRFREGTLLETQGAVEIELADDEPVNMEMICRILHHQYDQVRPSGDRLLGYSRCRLLLIAQFATSRYQISSQVTVYSDLPYSPTSTI